MATFGRVNQGIQAVQEIQQLLKEYRTHTDIIKIQKENIIDTKKQHVSMLESVSQRLEHVDELIHILAEKEKELENIRQILVEYIPKIKAMFESQEKASFMDKIKLFFNLSKFFRRK